MQCRYYAARLHVCVCGVWPLFFLYLATYHSSAIAKSAHALKLCRELAGPFPRLGGPFIREARPRATVAQVMGPPLPPPKTDASFAYLE